MKKLYFLFFLFSILCSAQTVLSPGEVMISGYNGDGEGGGTVNCDDSFSFVSYVALLPGTEIRFSEEDYDQWGGTSTEGDLVWTNDTGSTIAAETNIIVTTHSQSAVCGSSASANIGNIAFEGPGNWSLGGSNEEIIIFQGPAAQTITTAISLFLTDNASTAANTPPTLLGSLYIINFDGVDDDADVAVYSGPTIFSSFNDFVSQLTNTPVNWATQDGAGVNGTDGIYPDYPDDLPMFSGTLSVFDTEHDNLFEYYPNPVNNSLTLQSEKEISKVVVFDILGQEVFKASSLINNKVDMSNMKSGIYLVKVTVDSIQQIVKVVKK